MVNQASAVVPKSESAPAIADLLQPFVDRGTIAGAVTLVATMDRILSLDAIGYADVAARTPMRPDHLFWIASLTKPMTATAFMMLVDEGKVDVDDPVEKYLPEFKGQMVMTKKDDDHILLKKPHHPILVREILNHTSGLSARSALETPSLDRLPLEDAVRSYAMTSLLFEPGTAYKYSNAGTNTAGRIIEVISGMSYDDFMQQRLFTPLGMDDTTFRPTENQLQRLAKIYQSTSDKTGLEEATLGQLSYPLHNPKRKSFPAGGLFSTVADCLEFCRMILGSGDYRGRRYLSKTAIQEMTRKQTGDSLKENYGFGWDADNGTFGHGGAYKANLTIHSNLGLITIFLVHQANAWPNDGDQIYPLFLATAKQLASSAK